MSYGSQQGNGYATNYGNDVVAKSQLGEAPKSEIESLVDGLYSRAAELDSVLSILAGRLSVVMRQETTATGGPQAPRAVANTVMGNRLDDLDRQLFNLRDGIQNMLNRLEV